MVVNQRDSLDDARKAFRSGNYSEALEKYEYFFEHALDDDPHSLYGVRLSYCLDEWAKLGKKFPEAIERLELKKKESLILLEKTKEPECFHDYISICKYLESPELPVEQFLQFHSEDRELANVIVRFIWEELVKREKWEVCSIYLLNPMEKYGTAITKFDEAMKVCKSDPDLGGEDFERQIEGWYIRDICNILLVLKNSGKINDVSLIREQVAIDMKDRNYNKLKAKIDEKVAL